MATITVNTIYEKNDWEKFLEKHPEANFLQSWYWGEFHKALGKRVVRTGFHEQDVLVGVMLSIVEEAKRGRYLSIPGGPIIQWQNSHHVDVCVAEMQKIAKVNRCVFVRVRPQLIASEFSREIFKTHGFRDAPMHLHAELTSQLDITRSESELLAGMRKASRYEIKKAASLAIITTDTDSPSAIKTFYELQMDTARRQKFVPFSFAYLFEQFRVFATAGKARIYSALYNGTMLAQAIILFYGAEAVYHYGASTAEARKYPVAYLLQWEAIKEAKKRGMTRYNFWGVAPRDQKNHRFGGVSVFKRGFGGDDVEYLHAQDLVLDKFRYFVNYIVETIRRLFRNL